MAKKGPRPKPNHLKAVTGTDRPGRQLESAINTLDGEAELPAQFERLRQARPTFAQLVLEIWNDQMRKYRMRGQHTAGFDRALYQMCLLEAAILNKFTANDDVPQAMINGLRIYYSEFHDTPAGNLAPIGSRKENPFTRNGKRPDA